MSRNRSHEFVGDSYWSCLTYTSSWAGIEVTSLLVMVTEVVWRTPRHQPESKSRVCWGWLLKLSDVHLAMRRNRNHEFVGDSYWSCLTYTSPWGGMELTCLVMISTNYKVVWRFTSPWGGMELTCLLMIITNYKVVWRFTSPWDGMELTCLLTIATDCIGMC
jgi:hypothetical protein